jgi:hypothetical protein
MGKTMNHYFSRTYAEPSSYSRLSACLSLLQTSDETGSFSRFEVLFLIFIAAVSVKAPTRWHVPFSLKTTQTEIPENSDLNGCRRTGGHYRWLRKFDDPLLRVFPWLLLFNFPQSHEDCLTPECIPWEGRGRGAQWVPGMWTLEGVTVPPVPWGQAQVRGLGLRWVFC